MDHQLLIACDLHNTLLRASDAWSSAFSELSGAAREQIQKVLSSKCSRRQLATQLGVCYEDVYRRYTELVELNQGVVDTVSILQEFFPVVLISGASKERVERDLHKLNGKIRFDCVFSKETFQKSSSADWERLRSDYGASKILYLGNDPAEDVIPADFVQTVLIPGDSVKEHPNEN